MADKRPALGRGLSALIPDAPIVTVASDRPPKWTSICCGRIEFQPRTHIDDATARGPRAIDPHQRRDPADPRPPRWRAATRSSPASAAGARHSAPACSRSRSSCATFHDDHLLQLALIENIQREDLNPIEEAQAYRRLADEFQFTQDADRRLGRQGSLVDRELSPAAAPAARDPRERRSRARCRWATRARSWRCPTKPRSCASRATSSRGSFRCATPSADQESDRAGIAAGRTAEGRAHPRGRGTTAVCARHTRAHRAQTHAAVASRSTSRRRTELQRLYEQLTERRRRSGRDDEEADGLFELRRLSEQTRGR